MRQQNGRDAGVVVDHLSLGEPSRGIQDFVQVGQTQMFAFYLNYLWFAQAASPVPGAISVL
jgi:hypothetical protein